MWLWIGRNRALLGVAATMATVLSVVGVLRHRNFWSGALDMGVFDHGSWLLAHGYAHSSLIDRHMLADHVSPVLLVFGLLYKLYASPNVLLVVQAIVLAATVFPMARLARDEGVPQWFAVLATALSAPILAAATFDFHAYTLATPAVVWALVGAREGRKDIAAIASVAVLLCRADLFLVLIAIAILAKGDGKASCRRVFGGIAAVGVLASMIPAFRGSKTNWSVNFKALGDGPVDAITHPWRIVEALISGGVPTLLILLLPVALLPVLAPRWLAALVVASFPVLLSSEPGLHQPWFHYGAPFAPLAIGGAFAAIASERFRERLRPKFVAVYIVAALLVVSPLSPVAPDDVRWTSVVHQNNVADFAALIDAVPSNAAVSALDPVVSHLTHRKIVFGYPSPFFDVGPQGPPPTPHFKNLVDYVVVQTADVPAVVAYGFTDRVKESGDFVVLRRRNAGQ